MKPKFTEINYQKDVICWGVGNNIVGPRLVLTIKTGEPSEEKIKEAQNDAEEAEAIYNQLINVGQSFIPGGENANTDIISKITSIDKAGGYVCWKQTNTAKMSESLGFKPKPAAGKFNISSLIAMIKSGRIVCVESKTK